MTTQVATQEKDDNGGIMGMSMAMKLMKGQKKQGEDEAEKSNPRDRRTVQVAQQNKQGGIGMMGM